MLLKATFAAVVIAILGGAPPILAGSPGERTEQAPVEARVLSELSAHGRATFWVVLREQADLSPALQIRDSDRRGEFVYERLNDIAFRSQARLRLLLSAHGVRYRPFWIVNAIRVTAGREVLESSAALPEVEEILDDRSYPVVKLRRRPTGRALTTEWGVSAIRAPQVWSAFGTRGEDIVVGNIDTGVRYTHNALLMKYRGRNPDGSFDHAYNWWDPSHVCHPQGLIPCDNHMHGTFTMGNMVGDDGEPGPNQIGVAPHARWIAAKGCEIPECSLAALLSSGQFMLAPTDPNGQDPRTDLRPDIVNNSWGGLPADDPFYRATVQSWVASGIFPAAAIGNSGPDCGTLLFPASYTEAYAVGAFALGGAIAGFSSRGPQPAGLGGGIKPQIAAPGVDVRSAVNGDDSSYETSSGTSAAAPHLAGAVALIWSAVPSLRRDISGTRALLAQTAVDAPDTSCGGTGGNNNVAGEGRLDVLAAIEHAPPPVNDSFIDAVPLGAPALSGSVTGTTVGATGESGEPVHHGASASVWYRFTLARSNQVTLSTCGVTPYDTYIAAYIGTSVDALAQVAASDDACGAQSRITFIATAGRTYFVAVDGHLSATGPFRLTYAERARPTLHRPTPH